MNKYILLKFIQKYIKTKKNLKQTKLSLIYIIPIELA